MSATQVMVIGVKEIYEERRGRRGNILHVCGKRDSVHGEAPAPGGNTLHFMF